MANTVFYKSTSSNGKFQILTLEELTGKSVKKVGSNSILTHKGEIHKNLNNYWVTASELEHIKVNYITETASF